MGHSQASASMRFAVIGGTNLVAAGLNFLIILVIARTLGARELGVVSLGLNFLSYGLIVMNFGTDIYAVRAIAAEPAEASRMLRTIPWLRASISLLVVAASVLMVVLVPTYREAGLTVIVFALCVIPNAFTPLWLAQANENTGVVSAAIFLSALISALLAGVAALADWTAWTYAVAKLLSDIIVAVGVSLWARRQIDVGKTARPSMHDLLRLLQGCAPIGASKLVRGLGYASDLFVLGFLATTATIGLYSAPFRIFSVIIALNAIYGVVMLPSFSRAAQAGKESLRRELVGALKFAMPAAALAAVAGTVLGPILLPLLFGRGFEAASTPLGFLLFAAVLGLGNRSMSQALVGAGMAGLEMRLASIAIGASLPLKVALTWRYGLTGTAAATLAGEAVLLTLQGRALLTLLRPPHSVAA